MKKYLIISDASSMHVYSFIKDVILGRGYELTILTHSISKIPDEYQKFYDDNDIKIISVANKSFAEKRDMISVAKKLLYKVKEIRKIGEIAVCHIFFVHRQSCLLYLLCRSRIKHLILTYWGSDILISPTKDKYQKKCFDRAGFITHLSGNTLTAFRKRYGNKYENKSKIVRFGAGALVEVAEAKKSGTKEFYKKNIGASPSKVTVMIGYNALPEQRHLECIELLKNVASEIKENVVLLLPLQYARINEDYISKIKLALKNSGYEYVILEKYMNYEEIAKLTCATDVYVSVRPTDAFSCTMKELLFSGIYLIQGAWLSYEELDKIDWPREKISSLEELKPAFEKCVKRYLKGETPQRCLIMWEMFSPEGFRKQWDKVYSELK